MPRKKTVLVADDSDDDFLFLKTAFQSAGFQHYLIHVLDGRSAIDYLAGLGPYSDRRKFPMPDLLILDVKMPNGDGFDVLKYLQLHPDLVPTVVMFSGSNSPADRDACAELGAAHFFIKPISIKGIAQLVETIDHSWLT